MKYAKDIFQIPDIQR